MKNIFKDISEPQKLRYLHYSKKVGKVAYSIFRYLLLIAIGYIILYPLLYMIVTSLMSANAYDNSTRAWIPTGFNIVGNYKKAWDALEYGKALIATIKYPIISALLEVASCAVIGYGFARFNFKGKKIFIAILFLTILIPDMMLIIPRMVNYTQLDFLGILGLFNKLTGIDLRINLVDTGFTMWIPSLLGIGLKSGILIYIYIQFFTGLPRELEEAAWVDGAGPIKTFLKIAVPSSSVVFITVSVFSLIWHWNDSMLTSMYIPSALPLADRLAGLPAFISQKYNLEVGHTSPESASLLMAGCLMFLAPMLIFYMIVQRGFIESVDRVGITG